MPEKIKALRFLYDREQINPRGFKMPRILNTEIAVIIIVGLIIMFAGMYLNFQNLDLVMNRSIAPEEYGNVKNNEAVYGLIQLTGLAIMFLAVARGLLRRSDMTTSRFVNIMDVFSSLVKREIYDSHDRTRREQMAALGQESERFKSELRGRRI
jgi:hypothetical protein